MVWILERVLLGRSSSWYTRLSGEGGVEEVDDVDDVDDDDDAVAPAAAAASRKYRVSDPAPSETICFVVWGSVARNLVTRRSITVVRT